MEVRAIVSEEISLLLKQIDFSELDVPNLWDWGGDQH
jgi:hypothetical protein